MFRDSTETRLLVLGRDPDTDLLALLRAWFPATRFALERGELSDWLGSLWHQPPGGLVLFADRLEPSEIQAIGAWLHEHPQLPTLLVTGSRGSFGVEAVLGHAGLRLLPTPWTPHALRQVLGQAKPQEVSESDPGPFSDEPAGPTAANSASANSLGFGSTPAPSPIISPAGSDSEGPQLPAFAGEFLDGLVERVRDPLASLSGYLQLLQAESGNGALIQPALAAARELDGVLESLHLASEGWQPHPSRHSGERLAVEALKEAQRAGHVVEFDAASDFVVRVDPRLVRAGLQASRVLLNRFGGGAGALRLNVRSQADSAEIYWEWVSPPSIPEGSKVEIPAFLRLLLERFAKRLGAKAFLDCGEAGVPRRTGLRWPVSATIAAS
jgi:hypothetical protein